MVSYMIYVMSHGLMIRLIFTNVLLMMTCGLNIYGVCGLAREVV